MLSESLEKKDSKANQAPEGVLSDPTYDFKLVNEDPWVMDCHRALGLEFDEDTLQKFAHLSLLDDLSDRAQIDNLRKATAKRNAKNEFFRSRFDHSKWRVHFQRLGVRLDKQQAASSTGGVHEQKLFSDQQSMLNARCHLMDDMKSLMGGDARGGACGGGDYEDSLFAASAIMHSEKASLRSSSSMEFRSSAGGSSPMDRPATAGLPPFMLRAGISRAPSAGRARCLAPKLVTTTSGFRRSMSMSSSDGLRKQVLTGTLTSSCDDTTMSSNASDTSSIAGSELSRLPNTFQLHRLFGASTGNLTLPQAALDLDRIDLRTLVDSQKSPFASCASLIGGLYSLMYRNPLQERRLTKDKNINFYVTSEVELLAGNQHPLLRPGSSMSEDMNDLLFRSDGILARLFQNVIFLHHGPLVRKNLFVNTNFRQALLRNWKEAWYCIVLNPNSSNQLGLCELWVYTKEDLEQMHRWIDRCHRSYCLHHPLLRGLNPSNRLPPTRISRLPSKDNKNIDTASLLNLVRNTNVSADSASFVNSIAERCKDPSFAPMKLLPAGPQGPATAFPLCRQRKSLQHAIAFVDQAYTKYPDAFQVCLFV